MDEKSRDDPGETRALPALEKAWRHHDELSTAARSAERRYRLLRMSFLGTVFLALLLAILTRSHLFVNDVGNLEQADPVLGILRLLIPILLTCGLLLLAYASRAGEHEVWWLLRSTAAEIERLIYVFATILQGQEGRERWLYEKVSAARKRAFEGLGRELPETDDSTEVSPERLSLNRLLAEDYLHRRITLNITAQTLEAKKLRALNRGFLLLVLVVLGATSISTATSVSSFSFDADLWVVLGPALALSLLTWSELVRLTSEADRSREVAVALSQVQDLWNALPPIERTGERFYRLVRTTERILWCRYDDAVPVIRRTVAQIREGGDDLLDRVLKAPPAITLDEALQKQAEYGEELVQKKLAKQSGVAPSLAVLTDTQKLRALREAEPQALAAKKGGRPHAFVVMPFGRKQTTEGHWIDFDAIYRLLIRPALEEAGFMACRADEETVAGDILTDMFQELLLADLVIADLSIDNANVFYELGVRHAMRKRGLIHIQSGRSHMPFDIFNVRTLPYHCDASGRPDSRLLDKDRQSIVKAARETWTSNRDLVHSPIFHLLAGLPEPDRKALHTPLATGYWREYNEWRERVDIARRQKRIGDLLVLTEEVRNPLIQEEAIAEAGRALRGLGLHELALQQYSRGLELNPRNVEFRREEAVHLGRLKRSDEAIVKLNRLIRDHPDDIDSLFNLGEVYEDLWLAEVGRMEGGDRLREAYESSHWLKQAIETFLRAYRMDQNHVWAAIKLLIDAVLLDHVTRGLGIEGDPEVDSVRCQLAALEGSVRFTVESQIPRGEPSFSNLVVQAYLALVVADDKSDVIRAFKKALTLASKNRYYLIFTLERLRLWESVDFRIEYVRAAISVLEEALARLEDEESTRSDDVPPHVFLFAGHAIDQLETDRRFMGEMVEEARDAIAAALERCQARSQDLAITAGAGAGSEILFIEECLERRMKVDVYLPLAEAGFIEKSVSYAKGTWVERFYELRNRPEVTFHRQPDRLGAVPEGENAYERNHRWALYSSLAHGIDRMRLIVVWDGKNTPEDPADVDDMVRLVRSLGGVVEHINTGDFDYWQAQGKVAKALDQLVEGL